MSFCTACGNQVADGTAFCTKCGAKMAPGAATGGPAAVPAKSGSALKIILIVLGVILVVGMVVMIAGGLFVTHTLKEAVKTDDRGNVSSVNIGGTRIETVKDPAQVAAKLGVDVYPGAEAVGDGAGSMTIGGVTTTHAQFATNDSPDDVFAFYKTKYPNANLAEQGDDKTLMVGSEDKELLTVGVTRPEGEKTQIHITKITKGR